MNEVGVGDPVNLERPLRLMDRLGGHLVTGHVDGLGIVKAIQKRGEFTFFELRVPKPIFRMLVPKGSVALDGISLTVNECATQCFSIAIETDLIGKYVQQLLKPGKSSKTKRFT